MKMGYGYSADASEAVTKAICHVTGGPFSHCFIVFYDDNGPAFYFESISKKDKSTGKDGLRGPIPIERLYEWRDKKPASRMVELSGVVPYTEDEVDAVYKFLCEHVHDVYYSRLNCFNNWVERRLHIYMHCTWFKRKDRVYWHCSQTCMNTVPDRFWSCFNMLKSKDSEVVPSGGNLVSIREGVKRILKEAA